MPLIAPLLDYPDIATWTVSPGDFGSDRFVHIDGDRSIEVVDVSSDEAAIEKARLCLVAAMADDIAVEDRLYGTIKHVLPGVYTFIDRTRPLWNDGELSLIHLRWGDASWRSSANPFAVRHAG